MSDASKEHRFRWIRLGARDVVYFLTIGLASKLPEVVMLPVLQGLPMDCEVVTVNYDHLRRTFDCLVSHPSFDVVPEGVIPEEWPTAFELVEIGTKDVRVSAPHDVYQGDDAVHPTPEGVEAFARILDDDIRPSHVVESGR